MLYYSVVTLLFNLLLFSCSVMFDSLRPHGLQHTRLPCPSPSPGVCLHSCPLGCPSNHLILSRPLLLPSKIFPSIKVFSSESALGIRWPKYWSFSFSISPSDEYSGMVSFRIDGFDLLAIREILKSLLKYHIRGHQFSCAQSFLLSSSHIHTWLLEKP